jgi:hypothetical protein
MWTTFFRDGGWGMYPTSIFGFFLVIAGVLCLLRPERRFVAPTLCLAALTLSSGALGTTIGFVTSFHYLPQVRDVSQRFTIAALGCAESLNNLVLALILVTFSALLGSLAAVRAAFSTPSATSA